MTLARLYGRVQGHGSLAVVTDGFRSVLEPEGLLAGLCPLDVHEAPEEESHAGASARHGIFTGALGQVGDLFKRGLHEHYWIMVAPNSNRLPPDLVRLLTGYAERFPRRVHLMAPSAWAADIVSKHFIGVVPAVPHGVSEQYRVRQDISDQTRAAYEDTGAFRVVHFSTSDRQRKGTVELVQAWMSLKQSGTWASNAELLCVMDHLAQLALLDTLYERGLRVPAGVRIVDRADLTPQAMAQNLSRAHLVCQPSRGEAFGLVPLEALCCGVPVAATACTGHLAYLNDGFLPTAEIIRTGALAPLDDLPGSVAPSLDPEDIEHSLRRVRTAWPIVQEDALAAAPLWQSNWSWKVSLGPFVELLRKT